MSGERCSVFLALPQGGSVHPGSVRGAMRATRKHKVYANDLQCSILTFGFNLLFCGALNARRSHNLTHFAMLHADIEPEDFWLDTLLEELHKHDADVVSAAVPLKEQTGICSTGIADPDNDFTAAMRLTLKQIHQLPETFSAADCGYPERALLVNSGCWVMRFTEPWVEEMCFSMTDRIRRHEDGLFRAEVEPEDWKMSRWWHARGLKALTTRRVSLAHHGHAGYANWPAWGLDEDPAGR